MKLTGRLHKKEKSKKLHSLLEGNELSKNTGDHAGVAMLTMNNVIEFLQNFSSSEQDVESLQKELKAVKQAKADLEEKMERNENLEKGAE